MDSSDVQQQYRGTNDEDTANFIQVHGANDESARPTNNVVPEQEQCFEFSDFCEYPCDFEFNDMDSDLGTTESAYNHFDQAYDSVALGEVPFAIDHAGFAANHGMHDLGFSTTWQIEPWRVNDGAMDPFIGSDFDRHLADAASSSQICSMPTAISEIGLSALSESKSTKRT